MTGRRRVVGGALGAVGVAAAVLVLNPWRLQDRAADPIVHGLRGLGLSLGFPAAELLANVALFVPLGLLGALLLPRRRWWTALLALVALSVTIETVQGLVLPYRIASAHDVLANTLGAAVGVGLALLVRTRRAAA